MEIVIWVITVISISLLLGECYYRYLNKKKAVHNTIIAKITDSDANDELIEHKTENFYMGSYGMISRRKLQMRGSWRLAKDNTMSYLFFKRERDNEYKKML